MKIIEPSFQVINPMAEYAISDDDYFLALVKHIEKIGRICYKSEDRITSNSYESFVRGLIKRGHEAMLEHSGVTIKFVCDRGVSHELVRHRIMSFAQESTRYCNYGKDGEVVYIKPLFFKVDSPDFDNWVETCMKAESTYLAMLENGRTPQEARSVLPNSLKTEIVLTGNFREWRHFFKLRALGTTGKPHPQMIQIAIPALHYMQRHCPVIFDDLVSE